MVQTSPKTLVGTEGRTGAAKIDTDSIARSICIVPRAATLRTAPRRHCPISGMAFHPQSAKLIRVAMTDANTKEDKNFSAHTLLLPLPARDERGQRWGDGLRLLRTIRQRRAPRDRFYLTC